MNNKNIGDLIGELRKEKDMTQKNLADKLNITDKAVSKWERGISCPDINIIPKLAGILGVTSEELLCIQKNSEHNNHAKKQFENMIDLIFRAVGLAMSVAVCVLSILSEIDIKSALIMLSLGMICIAITLLKNNQIK